MTSIVHGHEVRVDGSNRNPIWSHDGAWIYYASDKNGTLDVWRRRADLGGRRSSSTDRTAIRCRSAWRPTARWSS